MKLEIKQRIEQIKAGQVPDGYKSTKNGVIPAEWNICKLKDVLEKQTMKNKDNIVKNVLTNSAAKGIVSQTDFFEKQIANSDNTSGYYIIKNGYFVYNPRISVSAPCGPFNKYYGKKDGIMSPLYTVYKYKDASEYYSEFLSLYFSGSSWYSYMNSIANYGARSDRMNVTSADMDNMPFPYPPLAEQEKIVKILSVQDRIIELYQRKIEELQKMKKIYLSKMFPKKGENAPEWRFSQFNDSWEQRKVSDLAEKTYGGGTPTTSNEAYWNGDIPWIQSSDVVDGKLLGVEPRKWITQDGLNNSAAQLIPGNSIAIITRVGVGKLAFMPYSYATSQDFLSLSKLNTEPLFTVYACYKKLQSELNAVQGTSIKGITKDELLAKNIMVPRYAEQQQIGAFFKQLDHLITLHQRKLEGTKKYKKALMQLLLTGIVRCE